MRRRGRGLRVPGRDEGLLARPAAQERPWPGRAAAAPILRREFRRQRDQVKRLGAALRRRHRGAARAPGAASSRWGRGWIRSSARWCSIGDGGIYLEALKDFRLLLPPFGAEDVVRKLGELRVSPLLAGLRGQPAPRRRGLRGHGGAAGRGDAAMERRGRSVDINPVIVFETGAARVAVDALVECRL